MPSPTARDWPAPADDEPDYIIRDADRFALLCLTAGACIEGSSEAADKVAEHCVAVAANLHLAASYQRWRTSRAGAGQ